MTSCDRFEEVYGKTSPYPLLRIPDIGIQKDSPSSAFPIFC
ncbi:MAG: hypothetical protein VKJ46_00205 [Leptolyngbyaceae bacterium]|nr:hypothetical protein [Leptolyngbyaceae bacterium]